MVLICNKYKARLMYMLSKALLAHARSCRLKHLERVAIFQIRSLRFGLLILRMSPETGSHFRETCFKPASARTAR
ncbi:hypothetical protein MPL3356_390279 [Mesorhizobium plurifarium]|uniref:Transposase n=1 Tax=Mesorhizobium plurifarium TaxID=69974 RepID=A0A090E5A9_MESPL|nr:hypothetical protein MPL3356_390279 [Mesorhizobium plurifarium]